MSMQDLMHHLACSEDLMYAAANAQHCVFSLAFFFTYGETEACRTCL